MRVRSGLCCVVLVACGGGSGGGAPDAGGATPDASGPVALHGSVQKGPFVLGSSVAVSSIDATGNPTGRTFDTQTTDDLGSFDVQVDSGGPVSVEANGFYYDEITGALSDAPITLRAFADLSSSPQDAYVNLVTHLCYNRVAALLGGGEGVPAATAQAETELVAALGVGRASFQPAAAIEMNLLGGDTDSNAYLFAVSAIFTQAAVLRGGSLDATLQELINTTAQDLADDGQLDATLVQELHDAERAVDPASVIQMLASRLASLGSTAIVPDLNRMLDSDLDGIMNAQDPCPYVPTGEFCYLTTTYPTDSPQAIALADVDMDGDLDALVGANGVEIFLNQGDGTMVAGPTYFANQGIPLAIDVARVDVDTIPDLIVLTDGAITVLKGNGDGTFSAGSSLSIGSANLWGTVFADFNRDGATDIAFNSGGLERLALADGTGGFQTPTAITWVSSAMGAAAGDVNHDGKLNVVDSTLILQSAVGLAVLR